MKLRITISKYQTWYLRLMSLHKSCYYLYKLRKLTYLHFFEFFFSSTFKDFNTISRKNQHACLVRKSATAINWGFVGDSSPVLSIWIVTARSAIEKLFFGYKINPLLTKLVRLRWLDIGLVIFCLFIVLGSVSVYKCAKKNLTVIQPTSTWPLT